MLLLCLLSCPPGVVTLLVRGSRMLAMSVPFKPQRSLLAMSSSLRRETGEVSYGR